MGLPENERLKEGYAAPREGRRAVAAAFCTEDKLLPHVAAHVLAAQHRLLDFRTPVVGEGHQAALGKVAVGTEGRLAHVLLDELAEAGNNAAMRVLDVDEQRARDAIVAAGDGLGVRLDAVHRDRKSTLLNSSH